MRPTLEPGDVLLIEAGSSSVAHGDIVVFTLGQDPEGAVQFIKRVIGVGGDSVEIRDGAVHLNGELLQEPYVLGATQA